MVMVFQNRDVVSVLGIEYGTNGSLPDRNSNDAEQQNQISNEDKPNNMANRQSWEDDDDDVYESILDVSSGNEAPAHEANLVLDNEGAGGMIMFQS